jgi:oligopeptide/dipeptide ABC transporter ATP-binding protein
VSADAGPPAARPEDGPARERPAGGPAGPALLEARDLARHYRLRRSGPPGRPAPVVRAVDGVSLRIPARATLGLVGESGCGKTTLGRLLLRLERPTAGEVTFGGRDWLALRGRALRAARRDVQAIFQDPLGSLDPRRTVAQALGEALGAGRRAPGEDGAGVARAGGSTGASGAGGAGEHSRVEELLDMVGLAAGVARRYPRELSGGQRQRVTIARAIAVRPRLIVCDEPVSALDVSVQAQIINLLSDLQDALDVSYLFISHNLATVRHIADEVAVMYLGRIVEQAPASQLFAAPAHPYTAALLAAVPVPDPDAVPAAAPVPGDVPSAAALPSGCRFRLRCPKAAAICAEREPDLAPVADGHLAACHFPDA